MTLERELLDAQWRDFDPAEWPDRTPGRRLVVRRLTRWQRLKRRLRGRR